MVRGVRSGHVDDVHVRVAHQFLVGAVGRGDAELVGEIPGPIASAGTDGDDLLPGAAAERGGEAVCDPARRDDAPP